MKKKIIVKEEDRGHGIYVIDVDKNQASQIKGSSYRERLDNAIRDFLKSKGQAIENDNYSVNPA